MGFSGRLPLLLPLEKLTGNQKFTLTLIVNSQIWSLKAVIENPRNYSALLRSTGFKCKTKTAVSITVNGCGSNSEDW